MMIAPAEPKLIERSSMVDYLMRFRSSSLDIKLFTWRVDAMEPSIMPVKTTSKPHY
jgi:hypothetical protein